MNRHGFRVDKFYDGRHIEVSGDDTDIGTTIDGYLERAADTKIELLFVFLATNDAAIYGQLKVGSDLRYGVHTVCMLPKKKKEFLPAQFMDSEDYLANILLKVNLKLGGINHVLPNDSGVLQNALYCGIDVTHPSPQSQDSAPSIAGVVANTRSDCAHWPGSLRINDSGKKEVKVQEMVDLLEPMIEERLKVWQNHNNGGLPDKIFVYRDGVSEGQYDTVLNEELPKIESACRRLYGTRVPPISIIIAGKRHHTRFYPVDEEDLAKCDVNAKNPRNGTCVDPCVTMEQGYDFFPQAHKALQGTARPAHYVVIHDENGLSADKMQNLVSFRLHFLASSPFLLQK